MEIIFFLLAAGIGLIPHLITSHFIIYIFPVWRRTWTSWKWCRIFSINFYALYTLVLSSVLFLFVTMFNTFFWNYILRSFLTEGDQNDPFTPRSEGEGHSIILFVFWILFYNWGLLKKIVLIFFMDCLDEEYTIFYFWIVRGFSMISLLQPPYYFTLYFVRACYLYFYIYFLLRSAFSFTLFLRK
jgi:hypothetical protein